MIRLFKTIIIIVLTAALWARLITTTPGFVQHFSDIAVEHAGEEIALGHDVHMAVRGLRSLGLTNFSLEGKFKTSAPYSQRTIEAAYPIVYTPDHAVVVAREMEMPPNLWELWNVEGVKIATNFQ